MEIIIPIIIMIWCHFIGDFILQSDYHATNKSKNNLVLFEHSLMYMLPFMLAAGLFPVYFYPLLGWILINIGAHFLTDYLSSRMTSHLWVKQQRHWFFVTIGLDQSIHFTTLILTYFLI